MGKKITDKEYKDLAKQVYHSDNAKIGRTIADDWVIVKKLDDPDKNGCQGVAVVRKEDYKKGKTDYDNVVIAYRGTEFGKGDGDVTADLNQIVLGLKSNTKQVMIPKTGVIIEVPVKAQTETALNFANKVRKTYKNAKINTTGHSLGGALASFVACMEKYSGVVFSAPNVYRLLDKDGKKNGNSGLMAGKITNFTNADDLVGNFGSADKLVFSKITIQRGDVSNPWYGLIGIAGHFFETYGGFNSNGSIKLAVQPDVILAQARAIQGIAEIDQNQAIQAILDYLEEDSEGLTKIKNDFVNQVGSGEFELLTESDVLEIMEDLVQVKDGSKYYCINKERAIDLADSLYEQRVRLYDFSEQIGAAAAGYQQMDYDTTSLIEGVSENLR